MKTRLVSNLIGFFAAAICFITIFRADIEAAVFPVISDMKLEVVRRVDNRIYYRFSFHKNRSGYGIYSAWSMYGPGVPTIETRYLFTPEQCDTDEPIRGGITPVGADVSYEVCATIPKQLAGGTVSLTGTIFYRVWHGGLVPTHVPILSIPLDHGR